ncbi:MAG: butyrate kinase [Synergistaceae bacterium]|jgi:butyrate kinase|nr:butyrate kinase [Synergistaceae bacterium]
MEYSILTINPGSTSTKIAMFQGENEVWNETIRHSVDDLARFGSVMEQFSFRLEMVLDAMRQHEPLPKLDAVCGRGGIIDPLPSGTFLVDGRMIDRLKLGKPWDHASNLGGVLADAIASRTGIPAFIVDPVCVDEMVPEAKITGLPELPLSCFSHALNTKATVRRAAKDLGIPWDKLRVVVVHLGGGITISAHRLGLIVDTNNVNECGPFAPERAGGLPSGALADLCFSGKHTYEEMRKKVVGGGGLRAHLGTSDMREVDAMIERGGPEGEKAAFLRRAMAWHIAKEIGAQAVSMWDGEQRVDAILFTGGIAYDSDFIAMVQERVQWIAPCLVYPGEGEMPALAQGAERVLSGEEKAKRYGDYYPA